MYYYAVIFCTCRLRPHALVPSPDFLQRIQIKQKRAAALRRKRLRIRVVMYVYVRDTHMNNMATFLNQLHWSCVHKC